MIFLSKAHAYDNHDFQIWNTDSEELKIDKKSKVTFETARKTTANQKKLLDSFIKEGDVVKEKINPELIAGIKIIINNNKQFDASMQKKLQEIF